MVPVKPGENNPQLKMAIRSWEKNLKFGRIWVTGYRPSWLTGVEFIEGNHGSYHANVYNNIRAACEHPDVADSVLVTNDDFFVTSPTDRIPHYFRDTLVNHLNTPKVKRGGWWSESLHATLICLQAHGMPEPLSYELHVPFRARKQQIAETLAKFRHVTPENPPQWRTLVGNLNHFGGTKRADVKAYRAGELNQPFHSTTERSFQHFHEQLRCMFSEPSGYEADA